MKSYISLIAVVMTLLLGLFILAEALQIPLLTDPEPRVAYGGWAGALSGVGLLVADVLIPIPASLVMVAHGAVFGVLGGTILSVVGSLGAGWLGFFIGRRGGPLLKRWIPAEERARANRLLERWGGLAVVVSRPIPILAETVAVLAGISTITFAEMTFATLVGSLPPSFILALSGAAAQQAFDGAAPIVLLAVLFVGFFWLLMCPRRFWRPPRPNAGEREQGRP